MLKTNSNKKKMKKVLVTDFEAYPLYGSFEVIYPDYVPVVFVGADRDDSYIAEALEDHVETVTNNFKGQLEIIINNYVVLEEFYVENI